MLAVACTLACALTQRFLPMKVVGFLPMVDSTGLALSDIVSRPCGWVRERKICTTGGTNCDTECSDHGCDLEFNSCVAAGCWSCDARSASLGTMPASRSSAHEPPSGDEPTAAFRSPYAAPNTSLRPQAHKKPASLPAAHLEEPALEASLGYPGAPSPTDEGAADTPAPTWSLHGSAHGSAGALS